MIYDHEVGRCREIFELSLSVRMSLRTPPLALTRRGKGDLRRRILTSECGRYPLHERYLVLTKPIKQPP